jgi:D-psicose/D-tagatose/L-ribulose 3-epimerase
MEQLSHLLKIVNHPNVKAMFDTHHANMEEKKLGDAIRSIGPRLAHFHISENDRGTPGSGHVPWDETFAALAEIKYKGWLTIEGFTRNDPDFANAIGVWRQFSEPWEMAESGYKLNQGNG